MPTRSKTSTLTELSKDGRICSCPSLIAPQVARLENREQFEALLGLELYAKRSKKARDNFYYRRDDQRSSPGYATKRGTSRLDGWMCEREDGWLGVFFCVVYILHGLEPNDGLHVEQLRIGERLKEGVT